MILSLISNAVKGIFGIVDKAVTDKDKANELKTQIESKVLQLADKLTEAQKDIILAELKGSWLQRNWRPVLMFVFILIIFHNWILAPYLLAYISAKIPIVPMPDKMWGLLTVGVGGYIAGRTFEKIKKKD
jgi:hypothetical protein